MKLKLKSIKNKKTVYILFVLGAVLLLGITINLIKSINSNLDTCEVVINYDVVNADGSITRFETYRKEHLRGEHINISSPEKEGYTADREKVTAIVKSDLYITVTYSCLHLNYSDSVADIENEVNVYTCLTCGEKKNVALDVTRGEFVFGGEEYLQNLSSLQCNEFGYQYSGGTVKKDLFVKSEYAKSLNEVFEKGIFDTDSSDNLLRDNVIFEIEYDESIWGENAFTLRRSNADEVVNLYGLRLGQSWRISFSLKDDSSINKWLAKDGCPLKISPITVKVIYYEEIK